MLASHFVAGDNVNAPPPIQVQPKTSPSHGTQYRISLDVNGVNTEELRRFMSVREVVDISGYIAPSKALFEAMNDFSGNPDGRRLEDLLPEGPAEAIYRNIMAFQYAASSIPGFKIDTYVDPGVIYVRGDHVSKYPPIIKYVYSAATSAILSIIACLQDMDFDEGGMLFIPALALKPLPGWDSETVENTLYRYAAACDSLKKTEGVDGYRSLIFGANTYDTMLYIMHMRLFHPAGPISRRVDGITYSFMYLFSARTVMNKLVEGVVYSRVRRELNKFSTAVDQGAEPVELPKSRFVEVDKSRASSITYVIESAFRTNAFSTCRIWYKYRNAVKQGFPEEAYAFRIGTVNSVFVPFFCVYSAEHLCEGIILPSTERAADMIRTLYDMPKPSGLEQLDPHAELLLKYATAAYGSNVVALAASRDHAGLVNLGLVDFRQFLTGEAPRTASECQQSELFHMFA